MEKVKLGEVVTLKKGKKATILNEQTPLSQRYIQIDDLRNDNNLKFTESLNMTEALLDDILIAWDGANAGTIGYGLSGAVGSTIMVLKKNEQYKDKIISDYLGVFLESKSQYLRYHSTGATIPHLNKNILLDLKLELLRIEEQENIICILNIIKRLITKRKCQLEELNLLVKSRFNEMFGDPVLNDMGWEIETLDKVGTIGRGVSKYRPRNASELFGGIYPFIQTGDVANSGNYIVDYHSTYSEFGLKQSKLWIKGTLCITIAANIAKTSILAFDSCFPDSIVGFIPGERTNNMFIHYWFSHFQKMLESQAPESAQKNINLKILSELKVILPPLSLQNEFADFVAQVDKSQFACGIVIKLWRNSLKSSII